MRWFSWWFSTAEVDLYNFTLQTFLISNVKVTFSPRGRGDVMGEPGKYHSA